MQLGYSISLEQTQKLIMTPELRQAITILQLSSTDLLQYLDNAMQENPLLEVPEETEAEDAAAAAVADNKEQEPQQSDQVSESSYTEEWYDYLADDLYTHTGDRFLKEDQYEQNNSERFVAQAPNLHEYLTLQLHLALKDPVLLPVGEYLIGNINEAGYLQISLDEVEKAVGEPRPVIERALRLIQTFDPPGVGAQDLAECLLIQLKQNGVWTSLLDRLVRCHISDLAEGRLQKIAAVLGITPQEVQSLADLIRTLDPKPGRNFSSGDTRYIVPDVVVDKVDGEYVVLVNDISVPRLMINKTYQSLLKRRDLCDQATAQFIENKMKAAVWLIRSVEQRRLTLYRVVQCIVEYQHEFLDRGVKYLKTLTLKQIAQQAELHESTVSRAIAGKYVQTPRGVFDLKFFFSSGVENTQDGEMIAARSIKRIMKELVEKEDPRRPLSDQHICEMLQEQGIVIARRTVAKYRQETGILPVRQRRRFL